ncbi:hypothetical protein K438DRAFT_2011906 [Mycena galopus ATCC 62051]|nr:hypothetical protein K438DRAFT_2011906 [Mycena galopus ATCC 62051]
MDLPLDVLLEILKVTHPMGLLFLARTTKALRAFLLNRSSAESIWRTSFENAEGSPPKYPSYTNQIQWTRLLFEEVCHAHGTRLPRALTNSRAWSYRFNDIFPRVNGYYLVADVNQFMAKYSLAKPAYDYGYSNYYGNPRPYEYGPNVQRSVILGHSFFHHSWLQFAKICRPWMSSIVATRKLEVEKQKDARWEAIKTKLCEAGWQASLIHREDYNELELVNTHRILTDAEWKKVKSKLFKQVTSTVKSAVMEERFQTLEQAFASHLPSLTQSLAFSPRIIDLALLPDVRSILERDLKLVLTVDDLKTTLHSKLPNLLAVWSSSFAVQLRDHTRAALKLPSEDPFESALAYFVAHSIKFHERVSSLKPRWEVDIETE